MQTPIGSNEGKLVPASTLLASHAGRLLTPIPGIHLYLMDGSTAIPQHIRTHNDTGHIHFNAWLGGDAMFRFDHEKDESISQLHGSVCFMPDASLNVKMIGNVSNVMAMIAPGTLAGLMGDDYDGVGKDVEQGTLQRPAQHSKHLLVAASRLRAVMQSDPAKPYNLLALTAATMEFLLHCMPSVKTVRTLGSDDRTRLRRARDYLVRDLAAPPLLADVAQVAGMSVSRLKRLFPIEFERSVYDYFQAARMGEARRLLERGCDVTHAALTLGYSNFSHFSMAFRNQHGVNPSEFKR